ncbi:MAG: Flp pilus assembly complex ATPase component TadA [Lachnospiraceae bacterium]|nr:Flp pilus assembly complex ATPase component TadA [Lachnospiraceae bacterium]
MNVILIIILLVLLSVPATYPIWDPCKNKKKKGPEFDSEHYRLQNLTEMVKSRINERIDEEPRIRKNDDMKRKALRANLRNAVREACLGDFGDREFLKDFIREILQSDLRINETSINEVFSFNESEYMSATELFEYIYAIYTRVFGIHVFSHMVDDFGWYEDIEDDKGRKRGIIDDERVRKAFEECTYEGCFTDKLEMLTQRCYESLYGHDVADILIMDPDIDGVSGGTGGKTRTEYNYLDELFGPAREKEADIWDTIYCVYKGKLIHMRFLSFGKQENLERIVKNIYRYNSRTSLSKRNPVLQSSMKNNSRVMVARPPVSDGWTFFVRKFTSSDASDIKTLITDRGSSFVIELLKRIVSAELNFVVSGNTGGGKTTLVKSLIEYINPQFALRVVESNFELNINNLYPDRNVHVMQERGDFTIHDAIAASKKTDTDVLILGEVNEPKLAGAFIQVAQSGSRMAITTLHHETTQKLIEYMRNALVCEWGISDISIAEQQVVDSISFDIHMIHDVTGHHYIERITQIVPLDENCRDSEIRGKRYRLVNIVEFDTRENCYRVSSDIMGKPALLIGKDWYEGFESA